MQTKQLPKIKSIFSQVLFISAIIQIILLMLLIWFSQNFYKNNKIDILKKDLFVLDTVTVSEIAKYTLLNNNYAINLTLMALQQKSKLDNIKLVKSLDNLSLKDCNISMSTPSICNNNSNSFIGITPIYIDNDFLGFIITKKTYDNIFFDTSMRMTAVLATLLIVFMIISNYFLILLSVKRYVNNNMKNLIKVISGSTAVANFNTKDFEIIANHIINEREQIKELQKTLSEKQLNEAIYQISARVAHDLNNPINGIRMVMPKLKATRIDNLELTLLETYINQIYSISSDVLNYFQKNTSSDNLANNISLPRFVVLEEIINDIIQNNKNWHTDIEFINNHYSWVYLIPIQLYRKITNLLTNAYESLTNPVKNIIIKTSTNEHMVILIIEDTGCGIPQEYLLEVLHGKSLKPNGHGFGLSSAVEYFESIGGNLSIESKPNIGTKITIQIPQAIPNWFTNTIKYNDDTVFAVLEDDVNIISHWQKLFIEIDNKILYFINVESYITWLENNNFLHSVLIINYELYKIIVADLSQINSSLIVYITYDNTQEYELQTMIKDTEYKLISNFLLQKNYISLYLI